MTVLVSPAHEYPINDDWIYIRTVENLLRGTFTVPGWSQASQWTHALWGAGFTTIFGLSITVLTYSMLVLTALGVLAFHAMLRRLELPAGPALLGALLLACNPILVHLSYSFMTDTSFLSYTLIATYCYLRGLQDTRERWLWLGAVITAIALLDRQFGLLIAVAALAYLLLRGELTWRRGLAVALLPLLAFAALLFWQANQSPSEISIAMTAQTRTAFANPLIGAWERVGRGLITLPILGLFVPLALPFRRRIFWGYVATLVAAVLIAFIYSGKVSFDFISSNIFDSGGFMPPVLYSFRTLTVGPLWLWLVLSIAAALLTAGLFTTTTDAASEWQSRVRHQPNPRAAFRENVQPAHFVYLVSLLLTLPSLFLSPNFMDRYLLPTFPALILLGLRRPAQATQRAHISAPLLSNPQFKIQNSTFIIIFLAFSLIAQRDYFAYAQARWNAGTWIIAQGVPYQQLDGGYEWNGWWLYDAAAAYSRTHPAAPYPPLRVAGDGFPPDAYIDPEYRLETTAAPPYRELRRFPYTVWLGGGETRYVLVLKRE